VNHFKSKTIAVCATVLASAALCGLPTFAFAQAAPAAAPASAAQIAEGTELKLQFNERLSSATNRQGDTFTVSLIEPITLADGTIIPAGFRGRGEVTSAEKRGFMGRAGDLSVRLEYLRIGTTRLGIRANRTSEGQGALGSTIALTVLFGPLGLLKRGKDIEIPKGQAITAFVDAPTSIALPIPPAPAPE
jgi:hypothetical protein